MQATAAQLGGTVSDVEMFKTFNMGWGFAIVVASSDKDSAIDTLNRAGAHAEQIGCITDSEGIKILYRNRKIILE
jgi:phosphoribosylaminoimidazole (AIR) synthetase